MVYIRLRPIHGIKGLVQKQPDGPAGIHPGGTIHVQVRVIPQHRQEVYDHKHEAAEGYLSESVSMHA